MTGDTDPGARQADGMTPEGKAVAAASSCVGAVRSAVEAILTLCDWTARPTLEIPGPGFIVTITRTGGNDG